MSALTDAVITREPNRAMVAIRCGDCKKLLCKSSQYNLCLIEIRCPKCSKLNGTVLLAGRRLDD